MKFYAIQVYSFSLRMQIFKEIFIQGVEKWHNI
jgi:hypothetical protein